MRFFVRFLTCRIGAATFGLAASLAFISVSVMAQQPESIETRLQGFDSYMEQVMKAWNAPVVASPTSFRTRMRLCGRSGRILAG